MKCRACGFAHGLDRCDVAARKRASNASNGLTSNTFSTSNKATDAAASPGVNSGSLIVTSKKQGWDREKYNANAAKYMREYRARKSQSTGGR